MTSSQHEERCTRSLGFYALPLGIKEWHFLHHSPNIFTKPFDLQSYTRVGVIHRQIGEGQALLDGIAIPTRSHPPDDLVRASQADWLFAQHDGTAIVQAQAAQLAPQSSFFLLEHSRSTDEITLIEFDSKA